jgi:hypothetical protein
MSMFLEELKSLTASQKDIRAIRTHNHLCPSKAMDTALLKGVYFIDSSTQERKYR